jgi:hypothetical protein
VLFLFFKYRFLKGYFKENLSIKLDYLLKKYKATPFSIKEISSNLLALAMNIVYIMKINQLQV